MRPFAIVEPTTLASFYEISRLPGVLKAEPVRGVPVRLRSGNHMRRVGIMGLPSNAELMRVIDEQMFQVELPPEGLLLTDKLAEVLEVKPGDRLLVDPPGDFLVSRLFDHRGKPGLELLQSPADGVFYAFVHLVSRAFAAGGADMIMRVFVEAIEAQNSFSLLWASCCDIESQPFIAAAEALSVSDGHAHSRLLDNNRIALRRRCCLVFHRSTLL